MATLTDPAGYLAEHYIYEINMLRHGRRRIQIETDSFTRNALIEAFALHARALLDFYRSDSKWETDVTASDFTPPGAFQASDTTHLDPQIRQRIDKKIQHLTSHREDPVKFGGADITVLSKAIEVDHAAFKRAVRPELGDWFKTEMTFEPIGPSKNLTTTTAPSITASIQSRTREPSGPYDAETLPGRSG